MNALLTRLNDLANTTPVVRPVKWKLSDLAHRAFFHHVRRQPGKVRYVVHGMRRTGNHAVLNWIIKGRDGQVIFCNDLQPGQHPADAPIKRLRAGRGPGTMITSYEDLSPAAVEARSSPAWFGDSTMAHHVIILRDPYNLFASRYVWKLPLGGRFRHEPRHRAELMNLWKEHARTYLEWLDRPAENGHSWHALNYNAWVSGPADYRARMGAAMGLVRPSLVSREVKNYGGGSSFEGTAAISGNPDRYLQRFEPLLNDRTFCTLFDDPGMHALYERIFAPLPGVPALLANAGPTVREA